MVLSNVMARTMVRRREDIPEETLKQIYSEVEAEGIDTCALEPDEVSALFRKTLSYTRRIFGNPRLHPAIGDLAHTISVRRTLSGSEIREEMEYLQIL